MSDSLSLAKGPVVGFGLSVLAGGVCVWMLQRRLSKQLPLMELSLSWQQIVPKDAAGVTSENFGETNLQAQLKTQRFSPDVMRSRAQQFYETMNMRRTMRFYSPDAIPEGVLEACIATAATSPSGAHHQPWFFAVVEKHKFKEQIRSLVEAEERVNYERRMKKSWIEDLSSMTGAGADKRLSDDTGAPQKPYLTEAPAILAMFKQTHGVDADGRKVDNYYVQESCGIAAGILITALHNVGLATLTSTPMGAEVKIRELLQRPDDEKLFLLMPVGYPAADATVPYRTPLRKPAKDVLQTF